MKSLATAALVGLALAATAVPALAQPLPNSARIGFSNTNTAFAGPITINPFTPVNVYVLMDMDWGASQNSEGVTAWEAGLILPGADPSKWTILTKELFPAGALNIGNNSNCIVGTGQEVFQLDGEVPVVLARVQVGWFDGATPIPTDDSFRIGPSTPSSFPSNPRPAWVDGNDRLLDFQTITPLGMNCAGSGTTEGPCPVATETLSWGAVKANR